MTLHAGTGAAGSTFTLALFGIVVRAVQAIARNLKNRFEVRSLQHLDDRALKDIGLLRSDVHAALDMPFYRDPSHHLLDVAGHGRAPRRLVEKPATIATAPRLDRVRRDDACLTAAAA
jgi:uncharacterized protein YjiS (DUF1127 family)